MADVILECKDEHALDVLELRNGTIMFRCAYDEAVDLIRHEKPLQRLIKMRELKEKKFNEFHKAQAKAFDAWGAGSKADDVKTPSALKNMQRTSDRYMYRYDGAYLMCKTMYGEETIQNVFSVYFGDLNK